MRKRIVQIWKITKISIVILIFTVTYLIARFVWLQNTDKLPYRNLRHIGSTSCYVSFKIKHASEVRQVVMPNQHAYSVIKRKNRFLALPFIYDLYMTEAINWGWGVWLSDSLFKEASSSAVDKAFVEKFAMYDFKNDTLFLKQYILDKALATSEKNSVIYLLLEKNMNCCLQDLSGLNWVDRNGTWKE